LRRGERVCQAVSFGVAFQCTFHPKKLPEINNPVTIPRREQRMEGWKSKAARWRPSCARCGGSGFRAVHRSTISRISSFTNSRGALSPADDAKTRSRRNAAARPFGFSEHHPAELDDRANNRLWAFESGGKTYQLVRAVEPAHADVHDARGRRGAVEHDPLLERHTLPVRGSIGSRDARYFRTNPRGRAVSRAPHRAPHRDSGKPQRGA
jgi:hypothetical protein